MLFQKVKHNQPDIRCSCSHPEKKKIKQETATESVTDDSSDTTVTTTVTATETTVVTTSPPIEETETDDESYGTLGTTLKTHVYTTYSGVKWWEITGNTNTGTDGYEDWFAETDDNFSDESTVTAGTSEAEN